MKILGTLIIALFLSCQLSFSQDTLYIYRAGIVVTQRAVAEIDSISFTKNHGTSLPETVADIDGNIYHTVRIGTQTWMVENLKTTKYNDGASIPLITDDYAWIYASTPGYCWLNNNSNTKNTNGAIYNFYAASASKLAPIGWHVATQSDYNTLATYLGGYEVAGSKLKETGNTHWYDQNTDATNSSGFTAIPSGYRTTTNGDFMKSTIWGVFWSSTEISGKGGRLILESALSATNFSSDNKDQGFSVRCIKDSLRLPSINTQPVSVITDNSAITGGSVATDGGAAITARGVCWSTTANPTITNCFTKDSIGVGSFTSSILKLISNTTYYVRAYATNSAGTAYGEQVSFKTLNIKATDIEGNTYNTVTIGSQVWMTENLKTTKYNDGSSIPLITDDVQWINSSIGSYCWYNNDISTYKSTYGALYNWYTVNTGKLAPIGWHIPSQAEINTLTAYLGGSSVAATKLKEAGNTHWVSLRNDATNSSGFTALPGGYRSCESGYFHNSGAWGVFWSSTEALTNGGRYMMEDTSKVINYSSDRKKCGFSVRCIKDSLRLPSINTQPVSAITDNTAICGGSVTADGGAAITARGVCWSTTVNPTITNYLTKDSIGAGSFTSSILRLTSNTTYYVRAYATNSAGTAYGEQVSFKTLNIKVTDIDGNTYNAVTIGSQVWMTENLKTTKYNDGSPIPLITDDNQWINSSIGSYCWYNNDILTYKSTYGALYNWYTVNTGKLAPIGWHIPSQAEINTLTAYLGGSTVAATKLKEAGNAHWVSLRNDATNSSGFTALPGGYRSCESGYFHNSGAWGVFWSSSEALTNGGRYMMEDTSKVFDYSSDRKKCGFSVRCIKDSLALPILATSVVSIITGVSSLSGGNVLTDGGASVTARGVCWSTSNNPTIICNKTTNGAGIGSFISLITGLTGNTTYYVRAYATNNVGTAYGDQVTFTTSIPILDIDGNIYHSVTIGTQTWMIENLKATRLNDGTPISLASDKTTWASLTTPGYCWYNNDIMTNNIYGALYNWYSVNTAKLAPIGWHVASDTEWTTLTTFLGENVAGGKLKEAGTLHWLAPNTGATNETNFTALPGGDRGNNDGTFDAIGTGAFWWTSTMLDNTYSYFRSIGNTHTAVGRSGSQRLNGLYVRCVKD